MRLCYCLDCLYTHAHRGMHVHHTQTLYSHSINLHTVSTLEHITEHCCSPKTWFSFKKDKPWRAEHSVDPEIPLFPLLDATDSIIKQIVAAEIDLLKAILKKACRVFHCSHQETSAVASRGILKGQTHISQHAHRRGGI